MMYKPCGYTNQGNVPWRRHYLSQETEHIVAFYATQRDVPDSIRGLPYQTLKQDSILGVVALGIAVWLAGGCLHHPWESTFLLSYGQCDFVLTGLNNFSYVYLASFLQKVAPLYVGALGLTTLEVLPTISSSSLGLEGHNLLDPDGIEGSPIAALTALGGLTDSQLAQTQDTSSGYLPDDV